MFRDHLPSVFSNPIIQRESLVRMRYLTSFMFLGIVLILGYLMMLSNLQSIRNYSSNMYSYMSYDDLVRSNFSSFNAFLFFGLSCMVPFISAGAINNEKERETWDLVATTPLNFSSIYLGKFISSIGFLWIIFFSVMPFYGIFFLAGSISFGEVFFSFIGLTEIAMMMAALGLWCSCIWRKTIQSVTAAFVLSFLYLILIPYAIVIFNLWWNGGLTGAVAPSMDIPLIISPLFFMTVYISGFSSIPTDTYEPNTIIMLHYAFTVFLFFLLAGSSIYLMYHKKSHKKRKLLSDDTLNLKSKSITKMMNRFVTKTGFPDGKNPVMIKDYRMMTCKRWSYIPYVGLMLLSFLIAGITFYLVVENPLQNVHDDTMFWLVFVPVIVLPFAGNCFRMEKDQDTFDMLMSTNIPVEKIVQGKFSAGLWVFLKRYAVCLFIFLVSAIVFYIIEDGFPKFPNTGFRNQLNTIFEFIENIVIAGVLPVVMAIFLLTAGMYFSATFKHTNAAYALTFITAFLVYFGILIIISMVQSFLSQNTNYDFYRNLYTLFSPLYFLGSKIYDNNYYFRVFSALNCFQVQAFLMMYASIIFYYLTIKKLSSKAV